MRARFGEFVFDSASRELTRNGEPLHLSPRGFIMLEQLISSAPRALTKDELYSHIWGDTFVEEVNLPNLVSEVRAVLGDSRKNARYLKTIHGYGYAFTGEVAFEEDRRKSRKSRTSCCLTWRREEFPLKQGPNIVGRGDDTDVVIDSGAVSRRHARIIVDGTQATIEDLGSKNGTFVRDERVTSAVPIHSGDEIRFGFVAVKFRAVDRAGTTVTQMNE